MSASTILCTRDSVKTYLGLSGGTYDDALDALIAAAGEAIERACGRRFGLVEYTEYHDGGEDRVVLRHRPVTDLTAVWDDPDRNFGDATLIDPGEIVLDAYAGVIILPKSTFSRGVRNVKATYTAGYDSVPDDAAQACRMLVAAWFHRGREAGDGLDQRGAAETTQRFAAEPWPPAATEILGRYRDHRV